MQFQFVRSGVAAVDAIFQHLFSGLRFLALTDNFQSFKWSGKLAAGEEAAIAHPLGVVPAGFLVVDRKGGEVERGDEPWTKQFVSIRNQSSIETEVTVVFLAKI